jgi:hypothetical protein
MRGFWIVVGAFTFGFGVIGSLTLPSINDPGGLLTALILIQYAISIPAVIYLLWRYRQAHAFGNWLGAMSIAKALIVLAASAPIIVTILFPDGESLTDRNTIRLFSILVLDSVPVFAALIVAINDRL